MTGKNIHDYLNNQFDSMPKGIKPLGGNIREWKIEYHVDAKFIEWTPKQGLRMEDYLNVILKKLIEPIFQLT